jgi:tyrosyl-tRNA synthetase
MINKDPEKINEVLTRGVEHIYPSPDALKALLEGGKRIRLYNGIDPTGKLHIGHLVILKKLRQFQDLGHEVIILLGDFTATIGDPTDKMASRKKLSRKEVLQNAKSYKKQIGKILDIKKTKFLHNADWTEKLKPSEILDLFSNFTVARLLERDMFQKRIQDGKEVLLHEFTYPVFQAYDSVAMDVDLEIGGNDQTFNMLVGRDLIKKLKNKEKCVLSLKLLTDSAGKKMGKTEGNMVNLDENPQEMFGKIMSWPDELIAPGMELMTDISVEEIEKTKEEIKNGKLNPKYAKELLAKKIVSICWSEKEASMAAEEFSKIFASKEVPSEIEEVDLSKLSVSMVNVSASNVVVLLRLADSQSQAKRLIEQGGLKIDGVVEKDWKKVIEPKSGQIWQAGPRRFKKIK